MSLFGHLAARLPFFRTQPQAEYFFALNIGPERLDVGLWAIEGDKLRIINDVSGDFNTEEDILRVSDELLDRSLGPSVETEPEKILFGVPDSWLLDDNLKEPYLKLLHRVVKELELTPMAYVATSHAITHFLEKQESVPTTAVLVGVGKKFSTISLSRAGKLDSSRVVKRADNLGLDIEKALLTFTDVEVLPSKILIYGASEELLQKYKNDLLSFPWMSKLSFLHLPKIELLPENVEIKSISLAGAVEINPEIKFEKDAAIKKEPVAVVNKHFKMEDKIAVPKAEHHDFGFVVGDVTEKETADLLPEVSSPKDSVVLNPPEPALAITESFKEMAAKLPFFTKSRIAFLLGPMIVLVLIVAAYLLLPKAAVFIFVEPRILERDTEVVADPSIKTVDEVGKKIPAEVVEIQASGTQKAAATGKRQVGDPAKGKVIIYNGTDSAKNLTAGTVLTSASGLKFTLNNAVQIASRSASPSDPLSTVSGKSNPVDMVAVAIGPDSNIPSGVNLTVAGFSQSQVLAKTEGNLSGGTSRDVTVVSDSDQKQLLASLASSLRKQAQGDLQGKYPDKRVLEEALNEEIIKKTYNKNINDQASEFNLNLIVKFKGAAYSESDLKTMVAKLVETNVPADFQLNLAEAETQADVSKVEKDGRVVFLAKFRAKLLPKLDTEKIKKQLRAKTPNQAAEILKGYENVLGSEIKITPSLPAFLTRLPLLDRNIQVEVGLR